MAAYLTGRGAARKEQQKQTLDWWQQERQLQERVRSEQLHLGYQAALEGRRESWADERQKRLFDQQTLLEAEQGDQRVAQGIWEGIRRGQLTLPLSSQKELDKISDNRARLQQSDRFNDAQKAQGVRYLNQRERSILRGAQPKAKLTPREEFEQNSFTAADGSKWVRNSRGEWSQHKNDTSAQKAADNAAKQQKAENDKIANAQKSRLDKDAADAKRIAEKRRDAIAKRAGEIRHAAATDQANPRDISAADAVKQAIQEQDEIDKALGTGAPGQPPAAAPAPQQAPQAAVPPAAAPAAPQKPAPLFNFPDAKPPQPAAPQPAAPKTAAPQPAAPQPAAPQPAAPKTAIPPAAAPAPQLAPATTPLTPNQQAGAVRDARAEANKVGRSGLKPSFDVLATYTTPIPPMITGLPEEPPTGNSAFDTLVKKGYEYVPLHNDKGVPNGRYAWKQPPPEQRITLHDGSEITGRVYRHGNGYEVMTPNGSVQVPVGQVRVMEEVGRVAMSTPTTSSGMEPQSTPQVATRPLPAGMPDGSQWIDDNTIQLPDGRKIRRGGQ